MSYNLFAIEGEWKGVSGHLHVCVFSVCFSFSNDLLGILWPRFNHILDLNVASIRDTDPSRLGSVDTRPHYV